MSALGDKAVALAQGLIRCPSVTPLDAGALDVLVQALKAARFTCERLTFTEEGTPPVDNLYARVGEGPPHLCFAGHTDVVPPSDAKLWSHPPFAAEIADGRLYGRGAADMKGAIACFAAAAVDYAKARGRELDGSISLLITGDEEGPAVNGTSKVLTWMKEKNERPDHCLVGEPTNAARLGEAIKIGRRGSLNGRLKVSGVQGHVAYPHLANNPVKGLLQILSRFYDAPLDYGSAHFSPSNLEVTSIDVGNEVVNVIPASAEARLNIRYNDRHSPSSLETFLREQATLALSGADLSFSLEFEPPSHTFLTEPGPLDALLSEAVHEITGLTPSLSTGGGTSDARFIKDFCPVIEFGLLTATIHKVDEHAAIADLEQLTAIYRRFIELYFETFGGRMTGDARPIGVFDSGMGGLTVLRALLARLPYERFVYLGDTARLPYGTKSAETVQAYALQATRLLVAEGVKMVVIACNTASAVALHPLSEALSSVPVIGVIEPGARAGVLATRNNHIAVIATEGTVKGGTYARAIAALRGDIRIVQQPCQVFVALAEEGWTDSPATLAAADHYLGPLFRSPSAPDTLVLGCTHFPVLAGVIRKIIGDSVALVDSAETTALAVAEALAGSGLASEADSSRAGTTRFFATDSPERFARVGEIFLGRPIDVGSVELVDLRGL